MRGRISLAACLVMAIALTPVAADTKAPDPAAGQRTLRPVTRPKPPTVRGTARTDIDRFTLAQLEARKLTLNPEADRTTLIRRVSFDLTGLPPAVAEIDSFLADKSPDAYEKMVERYLASPHYGERWGKHWLDAVGYADSNGYFNADSDRPHAWRYRDYVIRSFNADKPYDRFVTEQIAGDELVGYTPGGDVTPDKVDALTATHFLRNAPDGTGESDGNPDEVRTDRLSVLEGNVQNLMNSLLGITIQCARCHDHKFEPVTQEEYYSLQAILYPVYNPDRWAKPNDRTVPVGTRAELAARKHHNELIDRQVKALKDGQAAFADPLREQVLGERVKDMEPAVRDRVIAAAKVAKDKRTAEQQKVLRAHAKAVDVSDDDLAKRFPEYAAYRDRVKQTVAEREKDRRATETIAAFVETDPNPPPHHLLKRGVHTQPGDTVQPGVPASLCTPANQYRIPPKPAGRVSSGRRTALARWVTSPENPLFARVMVNRVWQYHFGTGIVSTPDNLGKSGAKPSHPDLLDWLAAEFVNPSSANPDREGGGALSNHPLPHGRGSPKPWSVKHLHRLILTSAVYRQTSTPRDGIDAIDPDNRLLSHFPLRRLDAEAVRDAMLHASGELDPRAGGPYVPSKRTPEGVVEVPDTADGAKRRSVYLQQRRTQTITLLQLFDAPSIVSTCGKRSPSTVPLQSLALLNSEFIRARAKAFAARLTREAGADDAKRLALAFHLTGGRAPDEDERSVGEKFLANQRSVYAKEKDAGARAWADLGQMLLASNAFLYVE